MITYTYQILELRKKDESSFTNTIKSFKIRITGTKDGESHFVDQDLVLPMPEEGSFIEYDSLAEQNLIDWFLAEIIPQDYQFEIESKFNLSEGTQETSFPWSE